MPRASRPDQVMAAAILDWLLYHSTAVNTKGEGYRLKEKRRAGLVRSGPGGGEGGTAWEDRLRLELMERVRNPKSPLPPPGESSPLTVDELLGQPLHRLPPSGCDPLGRGSRA